MKKTIIGLIILTVFLTGCVPHQQTNVDDSQATESGISEVINANNQFAFDMYSEINNNENVFFSPYSIATAMAMVYEGAKGKTKEEMQSVFNFPQDNLTRRSSYAALYNQINAPDDYKLSTANALWAQQDYLFLQDYLDTINKYYGGKTTNLDFVNQPEASRQTINNWVEQQTNNKIKDILPAGAITPDLRLVLTNAIYFKGEWVWKFDKSDTKERNFFITKDNPVKTDMMFLDNGKAEFNYMENDLLQMIELPYKGENMSMLILLPRQNAFGPEEIEDKTIDDLENNLTYENFKSWKQQMQERKIDVYLPKFTFETKYFLPEALKSMGMTEAFTPYEADFSGMDGTDLLYISDVIHQAFVEVNEEGTEAAAATAVKVTFAAVSSNFNANHPFIFMIQQNDNILFMGKVIDPR